MNPFSRVFFFACAIFVFSLVPALASVTVGGLTYSIGSVSRASTHGPEFMQEHAAGEFIVIKLTIRNVGHEPADISASDFHLQRGDSKYDAANNLGDGDNFFLTKLNPGTAKSGTLVFDVPANTAPSKYQLIVYGNDSDDHKAINL